MPSNRAVQLNTPPRFEDMTEPEVGARVTTAFDKIYTAHNALVFTDTLPPPSGLTATSKTGGVLLGWEQIAESVQASLMGARIWRAAAAQDSRTEFNLNAAKRVLVPMIYSTAWFDPTSSTASYVYWVQWLDRLGRVTDAAGGKAAAGA